MSTLSPFVNSQITSTSWLFFLFDTTPIPEHRQSVSEWWVLKQRQSNKRATRYQGSACSLAQQYKSKCKCSLQRDRGCLHHRCTPQLQYHFTGNKSLESQGLAMPLSPSPPIPLIPLLLTTCAWSYLPGCSYPHPIVHSSRVLVWPATGFGLPLLKWAKTGTIAMALLLLLVPVLIEGCLGLWFSSKELEGVWRTMGGGGLVLLGGKRPSRSRERSLGLAMSFLLLLIGRLQTLLLTTRWWNVLGALPPYPMASLAFG